MEAKDANCADEWWIGPWVDADLSKNDSFEPKGKHPDTIRLDWFLANMNKKGFDDIACGICSRDDIDAACGIPKNGITMQDISETMPPRVGFDI